MAKAEYQPRLKTVYNETIRKALREEFKYENEMQVPRIDKIVINMGVGEATADSKKPSVAAEDLALADPKDGKPTRVGFKTVGDKKVRFAKRSGVEIDG